VPKLPSGVDINNLIDNLRIFSWEAADLMLYYSQILKDRNYQKSIIKSNDKEGPVTEADLTVNKLIIKRIQENYKGINWGILSEENVKEGNENCYKYCDWLWILDPLDGTKDFIQNTGNYAMHLALNYKREPYIGVVLIPEKNELWLSYEDKVWCERRDGSRFKPQLSKNENLKDLVLITSKNHGNDALDLLIKKIGFREVIIMGSIGCKISSLLRGESDIYLCLSLPGKSSPKDWDFAAPAAILKAAGGAITNIDNEELKYGELNFEQTGIIVASNNQHSHKGKCSEIKQIIRKYKILPV
tara:strand:- start:16 stop:918 length:903 start_codon:yes stop_codon:yes gene_type:complete